MEYFPKTRIVSGGMNGERNLFQWTIENFDVVRESERLINAQRFTVKAGASIGMPTEWTIRLKSTQRQRLDDEGNKMWIGCYVKLDKCPADANEVFMSWKLKVKKSPGHHYFKRKFMTRDYKLDMEIQGGRGWGFIAEQFACSSELPTIDGALVMEVDMELFAPKPTATETVEMEESFMAQFARTLKADLHVMFVFPPKVSDAPTKIVCRDNEEFSVSQQVLSARSPVFARMFETAMTENKTGIVQISDISAKTMEVLLRYIYTGTLHCDWEHPEVVPELVYAADKYQLEDLLEFLDHAIGTVCTKENVAKLISLATKLSLKKAESDLFVFLQTNISSAAEMMSLFTDNSTQNSESSAAENA